MGHFVVANQIVIIFHPAQLYKAIPIVSVISYHPNYPIFKVKMKKNYRFTIKILQPNQIHSLSFTSKHDIKILFCIEIN